MKQIQGLSKRTGALSFARSGNAMDDSPKIKVGDIGHVFHANGAWASIRIDDFPNPANEGNFHGTVLSIDPSFPDITIGDRVTESTDFVFVVVRGIRELAETHK